MMKFSEVYSATLDQLTDELAAAGWDSTQTEIEAAREAVTMLLMEVGVTYRGQNYTITYLSGQFVLDDSVNPDQVFDSFEELVEAHPICEESRSFFDQ